MVAAGGVEKSLSESYDFYITLFIILTLR